MVKETTMTTLARVEEKINAIHEDIITVNNHLKTLNGQVAKNTGFRERQGVINNLLGFVGGAIMVAVISIVFKIFGG